MRQEYLGRLQKIETEFQRAGAAGAFNAGFETGRIVMEVVGIVAGGAGIAKAGVKVTEKLVGYAGKLVPLTAKTTAAAVAEASSAVRQTVLANVAESQTARSSSTSSANALRLRTTLAFQEAGILNSDGKLTFQAIRDSAPITLKDGIIKNTEIIKILTRDGSKIEDWRKFTTNSITLPTGQSSQIHFYKNVKTGIIDYSTSDYKVKGIIKP